MDNVEKLQDIIREYIGESRPVFEAYSDDKKKRVFLTVVIHSGSNKNA